MFTGSVPDSDKERTEHWIADQTFPVLTQGCSKTKNKLYSVGTVAMGTSVATRPVIPHTMESQKARDRNIGLRKNTRQGRVEEFLATGEEGDAHTKPFFFPVVSAATCTDHHLEVDQRLHMTCRFLFWKGTSVDTTWASVDTLFQHSPEGVLGRAGRVSKGSNLAPMTASHRYTVNHGV
ncbi:hypothetical protein Taro_010101 [Colocasia esculenta]|uniref:Uncharacterized protein n=1 Tax=Colocasia esculenta TaxID=4460 RepID=A0A843U2Q8_COLES|nr:hypothetical protein [Colocasia esculenta]